MKTEISELYHYFLQHPLVTTDTRNCPLGSIFFALRGESFDGNKFALLAIEKGCSLAVVDDPVYKGMANMFYVEDVLVALQQLANHHRKQLNIPIIGITGSNGKTTTKELVSSVLAKKFNVYFTQGNLNNHIGVPLTLLAMDSSTEMGVVEMGANHPGEIALLCEIAEPDFGIITNIGKAHIEGFGSYEGVRRTKGELYDHLLQKNGSVFVNGNDEVLTGMSSHMRRVLYGVECTEAMVSGSDVCVSPFLSFSWSRKEGNAVSHVQSQMVGTYNVDNFLAAVAVGKWFGVVDEYINQALSDYTPVNNRSQLIHGENNTVLMDAYNANPSSMAVALDNFNAISHPQKIAVIGSMKELGHVSEEEHQRVVEMLRMANVMKVYLVGDEFSFAVGQPGMTVFNKVDELIDQLKQVPLKEAFILVKGSRGNKLETILPFIQ